jgi:WD40 repeat protein
LWNLETSQLLATLKGHSSDVLSVQVTQDGRFAVSGSDDKKWVPPPRPSTSTA